MKARRKRVRYFWSETASRKAVICSGVMIQGLQCLKPLTVKCYDGCTFWEASAMGQTFEFKCPDCGYRAEVSGGEDCGDIVITETMVCKKCRRVVDVEVGFSQPSPDNKPDKNMGRCPKCHSDEVTPWGKGWPCPKCGEMMIKGRSVCLWD